MECALFTNFSKDNIARGLCTLVPFIIIVHVPRESHPCQILGIYYSYYVIHSFIIIIELFRERNGFSLDRESGVCTVYIEEWVQFR